jgi:hypothetical protein
LSRPAPSGLKELGYVEKADGQKQAIVAEGSQIKLIPQGDAWAGEYRVSKVTASALEIAGKQVQAAVKLLSPGSSVAAAPTRRPPQESSHGPPAGDVPAGTAAGKIAKLSRVEPLFPPPPVALQPIVPPQAGASSGDVSPVPGKEGGGLSANPVVGALKPFGYVEMASGEREAVVAEGDQVGLVREGDVWAEKYRVLKVTPSSLQVADPSSQSAILVPLAGSDPEVIAGRGPPEFAAESPPESNTAQAAALSGQERVEVSAAESRSPPLLALPGGQSAAYFRSAAGEEVSTAEPVLGEFSAYHEGAREDGPVTAAGTGALIVIQGAESCCGDGFEILRAPPSPLEFPAEFPQLTSESEMSRRNPVKGAERGKEVLESRVPPPVPSTDSTRQSSRAMLSAGGEVSAGVPGHPIRPISGSNCTACPRSAKSLGAKSAISSIPHLGQIGRFLRAWYPVAYCARYLSRQRQRGAPGDMRLEFQALSLGDSAYRLHR